jgi:uncharacterized protein (DUF1810 family)
MGDSLDLRRFVDAQASIYPQVVEELSRGRKRSHWMWFVLSIAHASSWGRAKRRSAISWDPRTT